MASFNDFQLDDRLLRALQKLKFEHPTLIQQKTIQLALEGHDIVAKASTGSGKSAAYIIPVLQKILQSQATDGRIRSVKAIVIVPTKELAQQVKEQVRQLSLYCSQAVSALNITAENDVTLVQNELLADIPDIMIGTPKRLLQILSSEKSGIDTQCIQSVVIDEADLMLSFGYQAEMDHIAALLPKVYQAFLMSATINQEVDTLKKLVLRNAVIVKLEEGVDEQSKITQYELHLKDSDKFLYLFYIIKLRLIKGKSLLFVHGIDRGYKLKLFLEQFSIRCGILNSELPHNSRYHTIQQFGKGVFEHLIVTDEQAKKSASTTEDFGASRGVDFQNVAVVVNVDFPISTKSYVHRVGRTARGSQSGMALSFVTDGDKRVFQKVSYKYKQSGQELIAFELDTSAVENFRYRCDDALSRVKKNAIRDARMKEIRGELLNSEKLKSHFAENPTDLDAIRHDKPSHVVRVQPQLKHVPEYLMPARMAAVKRPLNEEELADVPFNKQYVKNRRSQKSLNRKQQKTKNSNGNPDPFKKLVFSKKT